MSAIAEDMADAEEARNVVRDLFPGNHGQGLRSLVLRLINERDELLAAAELSDAVRKTLLKRPVNVEEANPVPKASGEPEHVAEMLEETFARRVGRLSRLIGLRAPAYVTCREVTMVWEAAFALYKGAMKNAFGHSMVSRACESLNVCPHCHERFVRLDFGMCEPCWNEGEMDGILRTSDEATGA